MDLKLKLKFKINLKLLFEIFVILPSIKPYVIRISRIDNIYDLFGIMVCFGMIVVCFFVKNVHANKTFKYFTAFLAVYFISTLINGYSSLISVVSESSRMLICPIYMLYKYKEGYYEYRKCIHNIAEVYRYILYIDFISILLNLKFNIFEEKIFSFLGMDNTAAFIVIPMLAVVIYDDVNQKGKIRRNSILLYFFCFVGKVLTSSVTAFLSLGVFGFLLFLNEYKFRNNDDKTISKWYKPKKYVILSVIILVGIVFFKVQYLFADIIIALGKDLNLGRVRIWENVIQSFIYSPLIGYGKVNPEEFIELVGMSKWDATCNHPHNSILAIFFCGGLIGSFFYIMMLKKSFKNISKNIYEYKIKIVCIGFISFLVLMLADDYLFMPYIYVLIMIASQYKYKELI